MVFYYAHIQWNSIVHYYYGENLFFFFINMKTIRKEMKRKRKNENIWYISWYSEQRKMKMVQNYIKENIIHSHFVQLRHLSSQEPTKIWKTCWYQINVKKNAKQTKKERFILRMNQPHRNIVTSFMHCHQIPYKSWFDDGFLLTSCIHYHCHYVLMLDFKKSFKNII